ncbi:hypothetical protein WJX72_004112 [[Myrmecia] bisecta]|uniref:Methyltransferase type 11 domain-containing protein n=1 Tax=[Myrmecia] bisecta TaxID=41462 RepID=A0AAW1QQ71_9CHLO
MHHGRLSLLRRQAPFLGRRTKRLITSSSQGAKLNTDDDIIFYSQARLVQHVDAGFLDRLQALYAEILQPKWRVLDLCSSWDSHLPAQLQLSHVAGHGMNEAELFANQRLDHYFIQDFNKDPGLRHLPASSFDAALCCAGIQYLEQPAAVLREVWRVLRPDGVAYVEQLLRAAGFTEVEDRTWLPQPAGLRPEQTEGPIGISDPFCAVIATKTLKVVITVKALHDRDAGDAQSESLAATALGDLPDRQPASKVSSVTFTRWLGAYHQLTEEAAALGIPRSALPKLPANPDIAELQSARKQLSSMIESFLSAGL